MTIPANDFISLNTRSLKRRSLTRSPPQKVSFLAPAATQPRQAARKHAMTLCHRPISNGTASHPEMTLNGDAHAAVDTPGTKRDDGIPDGHASPPIDWEIPRKLLHSSIGFFTIPLYTAHIPASEVASVLSAACAFIASIDFVRLRNRPFNVIYRKFVGFLMRETEMEKINGVIWYLLGCIFVLKFYPEDIAVVSILILSWCDTTASIFGRWYGPRTSRLPQSFALPFTSFRISSPFAERKSVAGFLAGSLTGALVVFGFWHWLAPSGAQPSSLPQVIQGDGQPVASLAKLTGIALVGGVLAGFAEAIDVGSLDDNLTLPIVSGGLIWVLFKVVDYIF